MTQPTNTARNFEFRAWDEFNKQMLQPSDIYLTYSSIYGISVGNRHEMNKTGCSEPITGVIMQFTGLLDSTGKKIFEGDILALGSDRMVVLVGFEDGAFGYSKPNSLFTGFATLYQVKDTVLKTARVIGNIYENPDLLQP